MAASRTLSLQYKILYGVTGVFVLGSIVFLPNLLARRNFLFTASRVEVDSEKPFLLSAEFRVVQAGGLHRGEKVQLRDLLAKYPAGLVINFWATWCPPCLEELPALEALSRQLHSKSDRSLPGLITVAVDEAIEDVTALFDQLGFQVSALTLQDPGGVFAKTVGTNRFPETYWINGQGEVIHKWLGPQDWNSNSVLQRLVSR
jgi:thiol-disulfide isomerase/thioredoxin